jgi:hypothetical protein
MTRRDVVKLCIFTPQTALRENTQHYRFWGLKIFTPLTLRFQDFQRETGMLPRSQGFNAAQQRHHRQNVSDEVPYPVTHCFAAIDL